MMLVPWSPNEAALLSRPECALSQVGLQPDMTFDVVRMSNSKQPMNYIAHINILRALFQNVLKVIPKKNGQV